MIPISQPAFPGSLALGGERALGATRRFLRVLVVLNLLAGAFVLALLVASLVAEGPVMGALGVRPGPGSARLVVGMRLIAVTGLAAVPLAHLVLTRLLRIVETVSRGDPFVTPNAARLASIAWAVLGLEALHLGVGLLAAVSSSRDAPLDIGWDFSPTRLLAVLLLFVLAQVFEQGARMREELDGTV